MIDLGNGNGIEGYARINVILGKNGTGKSTLLRLMDTSLSGGEACIRYITPERGGELVYEGGIETNIANNADWLSGQRRRNRYEGFRQSSVAQYRSLEVLVLRSIEAERDLRASGFTFEEEIERINEVLDRVRLVRADTVGFDIVRKADGEIARPSDLSSGESELISLAVEFLHFASQCKLQKYQGKDNWLLLDEPDVHLHPDLQNRLMKLLVNCIPQEHGRVAIATHSTTVLSSLFTLEPDLRVGLKNFGPQMLVFEPVNEALRSILPMFGAHPLSNVFNEKPILIVEGEDDERIWQAATRRSEGRLAVYPCAAGDVQSMNGYETAARNIIDCVYDDAKAFSLRDRDEDPYEIEDIGPVTRCRLACRNAENLLVSDDVLSELGTKWELVQSALGKWIDENPDHPRHGDAIAFRDSGWDRQNCQLKNLRMLIVGLAGSNKPWEVAVGQAIARLPENNFEGAHCLKEYLGPKLVAALSLNS